jgi:hypothetical protein
MGRRKGGGWNGRKSIGPESIEALERLALANSVNVAELRRKWVVEATAAKLQGKGYSMWSKTLADAMGQAARHANRQHLYVREAEANGMIEPGQRRYDTSSVVATSLMAGVIVPR